MHTADPHSLLGYICNDVDRLKPGENLTVDIYVLRDIPTFEHNNSTFTPADRVLGNIVGSAYTHSYTINHDSVTFHRHINNGKVRYRDPDRRKQNG